VENRNSHEFLKGLFHLEAGGCPDVLQVDAAEGGFERADRFDQLVGVGFAVFPVDMGKAQGNGVDVGEDFEEDGFSFHHGHSGLGADVAESQHGGSVADDAHRVGAVRVFPDIRGIFLDFEARDGHSGGVCQRKVLLGGARFGRNDFQFARNGFAMVGPAAVRQRHFFFAHSGMLLRF